ncbi:MAG TPA: type II secretion system F family protein [Acidimicrobiia bacterium]|nr:type II secretion system F family protein [Acidimicrobiia bacterium]
MVPIILFLAIGAVALGAWSASTALEARTGARRSLRAIENYEIVDVREQEMLESVTDRLVAPIGRKLLDIGRTFTPVGYVEKLKRNIVLAGNPPGYEVDRLIVWKVLGVASGIVWLPLTYTFLSGHILIMLLAITFAWGLSVFGPDVILSQHITKRRLEIQRRMPDTLDLLVISVEAGLGFEQALDRTAATVPGPLSEELRRMLQETRMGASRADALRALDERTNVEELRTFIVAMLQADSFGVSIARILRTQADEMRVRRRYLAQEKSQKAPVRMLFPLVLCIFPATLVVVVMPGFMQVFNKL